MIKKILILLFLVFLSYADAEVDVQKITIKFGKHKDFYRFVFIGENAEITSTIKVNLQSDGAIKIVFSKNFDFEFEGKSLSEIDNIRGIKIEKKEQILVIKTLDVKNIKVSKYENPSRLVVDAFFEEIIKEDKLSKNIVVLIDAGHGGNDKGLLIKENSEKDLTLLLSKEIAVKLTQKGIKASLIRASDDNVTIENRIKVENQIAPYLSISIHVSSQDNFKIYTSPVKKNIPKDDPSKIYMSEDALSKLFIKKIGEIFSEPVYMEKLPVTFLKEALSPALAIEIPKRSLLLDDKYNNKIIDLFVQVIGEFLKNRGKVDKN